MVIESSPNSILEEIIDKRLQKDWKNIIKKYNGVVQNYRMIFKGSYEHSEFPRGHSRKPRIIAGE